MVHIDHLITFQKDIDVSIQVEVSVSVSNCQRSFCIWKRDLYQDWLPILLEYITDCNHKHQTIVSGIIL